jgi:hypothetical protein
MSWRTPRHHPRKVGRKIVAVATLVVEGSDLVVKMSEIEKFEAVHPDVHVLLSTVRVVRVAEDAWPELRGIRAPGTGIPGVIAVGTRRGSFGKDFAVVHGKERAIVVELDGADYSRIILTTPDADSVAAEIQSHLMPPSSVLPPPDPTR